VLSLPAFAPLLIAGERSFHDALHGGALLEWWVIVVVALARTWPWGFSFTVFWRNHDERALATTTRTGDARHLALTIWLGLWVTPPDKVQGNLVRLLYVHPAIAWVALYVSFGTRRSRAPCTCGGARARW
jgi:hypothetical protein